MAIITGNFPFTPGDNSSIVRKYLILQARLLVAESKVNLYESALRELAAQGNTAAQTALNAPLDLDQETGGDPVELDNPSLPFERPRFDESYQDDYDPNVEPKFCAEFPL